MTDDEGRGFNVVEQGAGPIQDVDVGRIRRNGWVPGNVLKSDVQLDLLAAVSSLRHRKGGG